MRMRTHERKPVSTTQRFARPHRQFSVAVIPLWQEFEGVARGTSRHRGWVRTGSFACAHVHNHDCRGRRGCAHIGTTQTKQTSKQNTTLPERQYDG
jgi:hypothetical protein